MEILSFLGSQGHLSSLRGISLLAEWYINKSTFLRVHVTAICGIEDVTRA